ncbi:hypothetical protein [Synechococcus sp. CCY 0621]|uniref:hypothetical protein n=1 Tax=Synechococcus sp. CCY 0621 TaxID=2815603 RepID=UPI001C220A27|nr:hypothetical protein [Synechococcus sp. CCY 0621]
MQADGDLLRSSFVWLNPDAPVWHPAAASINRNWLLNEALLVGSLDLLLASSEAKLFLSSELRSVHGTLFWLPQPAD